jgi:hypothetical protein
MILLFRHAEKLTGVKDPTLSPAGEERAARLATYIPETFGTPDFIIATLDTKASERPYKTVVPLSETTGVPIQDTIANGDFAKEADHVLTHPKYAGKFVVICWHHGKIPGLAKALGAPAGTYPNPWDEQVFNLILRFDYPTGTSTPTVTQITEPF